MKQHDSGGYPVDAPTATPRATPGKPEVQGAEVFDPPNLGLADQQNHAFDGGTPGGRQDGPQLDGGTP